MTTILPELSCKCAKILAHDAVGGGALQIFPAGFVLACGSNSRFLHPAAIARATRWNTARRSLLDGPVPFR